MRFEPLVRHRLIERIRKASQYRVTLITASAGFGKSTVLRHFLKQHSVKHVRYDVRADNATLVSFVRGFTEALSPVVPHLRSSFASAFESARQAANPAEALAEWLHENIKDIDITFVIDDLHHVEAQADILSLLVNLVERSTNFQRWLFSTRTTMGLPVAAWWERGAMIMPIDENELQFSEEEALEVAHKAYISASRETIAQLLQGTAGWPMAFILGLSIDGGLEGTSAQAMQGRTREVVYHTLAGRAFAQVSDAAKRFMLATCKFPTFDRQTLKRANVDVADGVLEEIEQFGTFFEQVYRGKYRYADLFREFLERELEQQGPDQVNDALVTAARALEISPALNVAVKLYIEAGATQHVVRVLEERGFDLIEGGNADVVYLAVASLAQTPHSEGAVVLGLQAVLESQRGRHDTSDAWFRTAIDRADTDALRVELTNRFAEAMLHRYRADCVALLEPFVDNKTLNAQQRARVYSTLSTAYVLGQRFGDALLLMHRALNLLGDSSNTRLRASVYQQAAWISLFTGDIESAKKYGFKAIDLASQAGLYEVAARAHSVLYNVAGDIEDDPEKALFHLREIADCGLKSGSINMRLYALLGIYDQEAESGNETALEVLERSIDTFEFSYGDRISVQTLLPAKALRFAGEGTFDQAFALIAESADRQPTEDRRAYHWSEVALYAAAAGRDTEADAALRAAFDLLPDLDAGSIRTGRVRIHLVLACLLMGRSDEVERLLAELHSKRTSSSPRIKALVESVDAIVRNWNGESNYEQIVRSFGELRKRHLGGLVKLLEALPRRVPAL